MFKWNRITLIGLLLLSINLFAQIPTTIRSVSSLPATCNGGSPTLLSDEVVLISGGVGTLYLCTAINTWTAVGSASLPFSALTAATNTTANPMLVGSGAYLGFTGTGQLWSNYSIPATTSGTSPGTLDYTGCSSQTPALAASKYTLLANGHFAEYGCTDETVSTNVNPPAGTPEITYRTWLNNTGVQVNQMRNNFFGGIYAPGLGGVLSNATTQSRMIGLVWDNSYAGASQDYDQESTVYAEWQLSGASTNFHGHAGGEVDMSVFRGSPGDSRSACAGSCPNIFTVYSAQISRLNAGAFMSTSGGKWVGYRAFATNSVGGAFVGNQEFDGFIAESSGSTGGATGNLSYYGFHSLPPTSSNYFPLVNAGFYSEPFATCSNCYDYVGNGVNAAGTASGWSAFIGPTVFGAQAHAASGNQVEVRGGFLSLSRQRFTQATNQVIGDYTVGANWGASASLALTVTTSRDSAWVVTITSSGAGIAANPTFILTFHDGTWTNVPVCLVKQTGGNDITAETVVTARSATAYTWQWNGTPTTGKTYEFTGLCSGT